MSPCEALAEAWDHDQTERNVQANLSSIPFASFCYDLARADVRHDENTLLDLNSNPCNWERKS